MQLYKTGKSKSGLDDGHDTPKGKKRKRGQDEAATQQPPEESVTEGARNLKIQPGESLRDFSARVDQAIPVAGLVRKGKPIKGAEERRTKHEKRLRKMQAAWREEDARIKEKEAEAKELAEEEKDERRATYGDETVDFETGGKQGKRKGGHDKDDPDPWAGLRKTREQPKGLHDVAQAPPQFTKIPKEKFKVRNGAKVNVEDVPNAAGSLRRREELGETRKSIIESYRRMMEDKRSNQ